MATVVFKKILCISIVHKSTTHCRKREREQGSQILVRYLKFFFCLNSLRQISEKDNWGCNFTGEETKKKNAASMQNHM
jgi:hypothetical protein